MLLLIELPQTEDNKGENKMFVIKNTKRDYDCYLSENNKWEGLLKAKVYNTKEEAEKVELPSETGKVVSWENVVNVKF